MTPQRTLIDIQNLMDALSNSGVAISTNKAVLNWLQSSGRQRVTWATNSRTPGALFRSYSATLQEYVGWVENSSYSALLLDGGILQISYDFDGQIVVAHRLCFFPCPFDLDVSLVRELPFRDVIELYAESSQFDDIRLRTPVRFDYDFVNAAVNDQHPTTHMTFQWSHVRLPVVSPLSLGHFVRFVFRNFYPSLWRVHSFLHDRPVRFFGRTLEREELRDLHLNIVDR